MSSSCLDEEGEEECEWEKKMIEYSIVFCALMLVKFD